MPKLGDIFPSRFFKEGDLATPLLLTIDRVYMDKVGRGKDQETKAILSFKQSDKELTLNKTNATRIEKFAGDDTDKWPGTQIVVFWDPEVDFGGDITGGVRVRAPKAQGQAATPAAPPPPDLPF